MEQAVLAPVRELATMLNERVYEALLRAIAEGLIPPGQRLMLDEVAAQLRVSRTPVRDAISRLVAEGLVEPTGSRGFRVTLLTRDDLAQLYDLRHMCETYAVERGLGNLTLDLLARLEHLANQWARVSAAPDLAEWLDLTLKDQEFHQLIVGLANNPRLSDLFRRLCIHIQTFRVGPFFSSAAELKEAYLAEHRAIMAALRTGDVALAKQAVSVHVRKAMGRTLALDGRR